MLEDQHDFHNTQRIGAFVAEACVSYNQPFMEYLLEFEGRRKLIIEKKLDLGR